MAPGEIALSSVAAGSRFLFAFAGFSGYAGNGATSSEDVLVGREFSYTVKAGDSLALVGARFAASSPSLARSNGLSPTARLRTGQRLRVDNRHVIPFFLKEGILVNIPQRLLFLFQEGRLVAWYPIGVGRRDWPTSTGSFQIQTLERRPTWDVPISIQDEMRRLGKRVVTHVPPGPDNPLGDYWMGLGGAGCGIHGTNAPASIYGFSTHGCIRLHPDDIADLFPRVSRGMTVEVVYEPILLTRALDGPVFLEVNPDRYGGGEDPLLRVEVLVRRQQLSQLLDPSAVERALAAKDGLAARVDLR